MSEKEKKPLILQMRYTDAEKELIRNTFKDKDEMFKLLRKIFLVPYDTEAPVGQAVDMWMSVPTENQTPEQVWLNVKARNLVLNHIENCLREMWMISQTNPDETPEEMMKRIMKNSNK